MIFKVAWSCIYLQFSSFNFFMSGLFGDLLCLRFFLSWAYFWLLVNAIAGFPSWNEFFASDVFILHYDVLAWSAITFYVHFSKFLGIVLNERKVTDIPDEFLPLYHMLYRTGGLSALLFQQFVLPRFELVEVKKGDLLVDDENSMYLILEGRASANITIRGKTQVLLLGSGEAIHFRHLHLFRQGAECEAFAEQTVHAVAQTKMKLYKTRPSDIQAIARQPQTKQAYQGLLIFVLTRIAERAILQGRDMDEYNQSVRAVEHHWHPAFQPLAPWEEADFRNSGSGKALEHPIQHFAVALQRSFRPPYPFIRWIPGLRHAGLPAPHHLPPAPPSVSDETRSLHDHTKKKYGSHNESSTIDSSSEENKSLLV
jgi:hypothetical protein